MKIEDGRMAASSAYYAPLVRYASIILRNKTIAEGLVKKAFEEQTALDGNMELECLRDRLKADVLALCFSWKLEQDAADFKGRAMTERDIGR